VPYALYRMHGFFSASFAARTGVTSDDLTLFYEAACAMFDTDRSAARGEMAVRGLHVFSHTSVLGDAPARDLLERIDVRRREGVGAARSFGDYRVVIDAVELPSGVELTSLVSG
jgi:CRISPR-associated protein Csd2